MQPEAPLRLLFMTSIPRWGGGERWMLDSAQGLMRRGHEVLVAARPGASILQRAAEAGVPTRAVFMAGDLDPRALFAVRSVLTQHRPHAVFVNLDKELRSVCLATLTGWQPLVFPRRGSDDPLKSGLLNRYVYGKRVSSLLTNSTHLAETRLASESWLPPDLVRVIRNGVAVEPSDGGRSPDLLRKQLELPRKQPLILHVGELEARKGQETSLRALALVLEKQDPTASRGLKPNLAFVGTGPDEARLRDLCHQLGVQAHITWVGFRTNVAEYMDAADVLVLPSRREGLPWTVLEAMARGIPVIASAVSGTPELIAHGENGILVPAGEPAALAGAIESVLGDPELAERLRRRALRTIREGWQAEYMLSDLECLVYAHLVRRALQSQRHVVPALFVDRDGTLVRNIPYNSQPERLELVPNVGRALRWLRDAGIGIVVVSNQSGVARGLHSESDVQRVNLHLQELLAREGVKIQAFYHCPHHPDYGPACGCRKPEPGLLLRAGQEHGVDLRRSWMVGDNRRDLEAGRRAGMRALGYVTPGAESDLGPGEARQDWLGIVRDFLRTLSVDRL